MEKAKIASIARALIRALAISVMGGLVTTASLAQEPTTYLGTLTCTLSPASDEPFGVERELSCTFEPMTGPQADLEGVIKRPGASVQDPSKVVMIWTVFGPSADTPVAQLEGRYVGSLGAETEHGLLGGRDASIRLKPLTNAPDFVNAALSILELELSAMRA